LTAIQEESAVVILAVIECTIFQGVVKSVAWIVAAVRFAVEPDSASPTGLPSPDSATMIPSMLAHPRQSAGSRSGGRAQPGFLQTEKETPAALDGRQVGSPIESFLGVRPGYVKSNQKTSPRR
jgi:hypothetical protein